MMICEGALILDVVEGDKISCIIKLRFKLCGLNNIFMYFFLF